MDLISTLASTIGVEPAQAQALAGTVLGGAQNALQDEAGPEAAKELGEAVPELSGWQSMAASVLGGEDEGGAEESGIGGLLGGLTSGAGGGLLGAAAGALGGQTAKDTAAVVGILSRFDIDASKAALVAPVILNFLKDRLDPGLLSKVLAVAPMLAGGESSEADGAGGLAGALGGLFG